MKKILALLMAVLMTLGTMSAFASESAVDRATGVITISGTAEPGARVMLLVLKEGKTAEHLVGLAPSDMMQVVEHIDQTTATGAGRFVFTYSNDKQDNYARYVALVNTTNQAYEVETLEINYYTNNTSGALSAQIIGFTDKLEVLGVINSDTLSILELDTTFFDLISDEEKLNVYKAMADMTEGSLAEVQKTFYEACAVEYINNQTSFNVLYEMLKSEDITDDALGFNKEQELYKGLDSTKALEERIMGALPTDSIESLRTSARAAFALEAIENYKYTFIEEILTTYNDALGLDLDGLTSDIETDVYKDLAGKHFADSAALQEAFYDAVNDAEEDDKGSSSGGSSGGGGGSFSGAGTGSKVSASETVIPSDESNGLKTNAKEEGFNDLADNHYAAKAVEALVEKGVISGYPDGSFAPDKAVSRMEFIKMLVVAFGIEKTDAEIGEYTDLSKDSWYYDYCAAAISNNILSGISETEIGADLSVKRQDVCVLLSRMLKNSGYELDASVKASFADENEISDYAKESVAIFADSGIISGSDGKFAPQKVASRAECAKIIYNVMMEVMQ